MMNNYLLLKFKDAKLFKRIGVDKIKYKIRDFSFNVINKSYGERTNLPSFIEPITVHQISNVLHVLFNERPTSTIRGSLYNKNEYLFEKAKNSYLKITTPKRFNKASNSEEYVSEIIHAKKAVWNSWKNNEIKSVNWEMIRRYFNNQEKFQLFINDLNQILNFNSRKIPFDDIINKVLALDINSRLLLYSKIKKYTKCDGLIYLFGRYDNGIFEPPKYSAITSLANRGGLTVNNGIQEIFVFSGEIIIPVDENDLNIIKNFSTGTANILDGGFVWIDSIINANEFYDDGYTLVSDISTEMTIPYSQKFNK